MIYEEAKTLLNRGKKGMTEVVTWLTHIFEQNEELASANIGFDFWQIHEDFEKATNNTALADVSSRLKDLIKDNTLKPYWREDKQKTLNLSYMLHSLEFGKSVLFLGANLITQEGEPPHKHFYCEIAQQCQDNGTIYNAEEGFFAFNKKEKRKICSLIASQYMNDAGITPEHLSLYNEIARLPFSLIINLTPYRTLHKVFQNKPAIDFEEAHFDDGRQALPTPSPYCPLIYNLFGDCVNEESLIIGYDDLFRYLQKLLTQDTSLLSLRKLLQNANNLVFLGFEFDKWYSQILLNALELHQNEETPVRQALEVDLQTNKIAETLCESHFHFTFVGANDATQFIHELVQQCITKQIKLRR